MKRSGLLAFSLLGCSALGCGADPKPPAAAPEPPKATSARPPGGVGVSAEIGALDEEATRKGFERASKGLMACYEKGAARVPFLAGDVAFYVRVAGDGSTKYAYVRDSSLGDRRVEECMLGVLKGIHWPQPVGGAEGEAKNDFHFEPGTDERPPVTWQPAQLGSPFRNAKEALRQCQRSAGAGPMKVTMYVETDGKPLAVGVSASDEKGEKAAACVVDALSNLTFPSPGSYASKVTVPIE